MAESTRADQIFARFVAFHEANPHVWQLFEKYTKLLLAKGFDHYSIDGIVQKIRWDVTVETTGEAVKINDHYSAYYARMWAAAYPMHADFYELRRRKSTERGAHPLDVAVHHDGPAVGEEALLNQLRAMVPHG